MSHETHYRKLERMYYSAPTNEYFAPKLTVSEGKSVVEIAVRDDFMHGAGSVHGCFYFKAMDDAAFFAVSSLVADEFVLTASFNLYLTRPVAEGTLRAEGEVVHQSRRLFVAEARLMNDDGKELGRGSGTYMRSRMPLSAEMGYR